jgi:2-furoyl-CoA dehydrogenase FAD binding subunit
VKPASFDYLAPETVDEATATLAERGDDARVMAGGQSLMPILNMRLARPVLGGEVVLKNARRQRTVGANEFQTGMLSTAKAADEIAVAARYPVAQSGAGHAFLEVTRRRGDFAIVALAAVAHGGKVRLGVGGIADRPVVRDWDGLDGDALDDALNAFAWELGGSDDIHATARYRREMVRTLGRRAIEQARDACRS